VAEGDSAAEDVEEQTSADPAIEDAAGFPGDSAGSESEAQESDLGAELEAAAESLAAATSRATAGSTKSAEGDEPEPVVEPEPVTEAEPADDAAEVKPQPPATAAPATAEPRKPRWWRRNG
jgi:hypothetical protein